MNSKRVNRGKRKENSLGNKRRRKMRIGVQPIGRE